mmetsp:Transcript_28337/g.74384  ORF Transcript_28337/g.74384 Transcript_28337/m.74384 type:complete len:219 (-) Transcript_28337:85-741(-)
MWHLLTSEHVLKFIFETITDVSFLPGLILLGRRGRPFETFIGVAQFITSFYYNLCDALDIQVILNIGEWHRMNQIFTITLGCFVLVYLMGNRNETRDHVLRYTVFFAVWVFQEKDKYWMEESQYTLCVPIACAILLAGRLLNGVYVKYNKPKLARGCLATAVAGLFFWASLSDMTDPFRLLHGLSQVTIGVALYYLWQVIPPDNYYKKSDTVLPRNYK